MDSGQHSGEEEGGHRGRRAENAIGLVQEDDVGSTGHRGGSKGRDAQVWGHWLQRLHPLDNTGDKVSWDGEQEDGLKSAGGQEGWRTKGDLDRSVGGTGPGECTGVQRGTRTERMEAGAVREGGRVQCAGRLLPWARA